MQTGRNISIRPTIASDIPELTRIGKEQLGVDYVSDDDYIDAMEDPGQFCLTVVLDGEPSGFAICKEFGPEGEKGALALPDGPQKDWVLNHSRIGLLDSVAIDDSAKGLGVGRMLCETCLEVFSKDGCDGAVSMAWVHFDGKEPIRKALAGIGMERTSLVIEGYWNQWVGSFEGHHCPYCGAPCKCFGAMWLMEL